MFGPYFLGNLAESTSSLARVCCVQEVGPDGRPLQVFKGRGFDGRGLGNKGWKHFRQTKTKASGVRQLSGQEYGTWFANPTCTCKYSVKDPMKMKGVRDLRPPFFRAASHSLTSRELNNSEIDKVFQ